MADEDKVPEAEEDGADEAQKKQGFVKKLMGNKKLLIAGAALIVVLLAGGGALMFFSGGGEEHHETAKAEHADKMPDAPPQVAYFNLPEILVNIQTVEGASAYLKVSVALELVNEEEKASIEILAPRIIDYLQGYLRELRVDDLKGSAGIMLLKEEMLRRVTMAAAPYPVRDVLLKEMVVQ